MSAWGALVAAAMLMATPDAGTPDDQSLVFYNARLALREGAPAEAVKLWLLHNSIHHLEQQPVTHEDDFRSALWVSLGELGVCPDGIPPDTSGGAALWRLAAFNWLLLASRQSDPPAWGNPFDAFQAGYQERFISVHDVLSAEELHSAEFAAGPTCFLPNLAQLERGHSPLIDITDPLESAPLLRWLLAQGLTSVDRQKFASVAPLEARLFDLDLALGELHRASLEEKLLTAQEKARQSGMSASAVAGITAKKEVWPENSAQARFLRRSLHWRPDEWLMLSRERRLSLFAQAEPFGHDPALIEQLLFGIIDSLIDQKEGTELEQWIGFLDLLKQPSTRASVFSGSRGKRLLELGVETGFRERAAIALHRGVAFLETGRLFDALTSFAFALSKADESREPDQVRGLARRWLSFTLAQFETNDEVLTMLKALIGGREYNTVIEDLVWRAALRADAASFERIVATIPKGSSFDARIEELRPLALGNPGLMATHLKAAAAQEPYFTLRFLRQLLERLELENAEVRLADLPMIKVVLEVIASIEAASGPKTSAGKAATELMGRTNAILDGLSVIDASNAGKARGLSPHREAFAGSVRLAPADALPWPFHVPETPAPSAFIPLKLVPIEWRDANDALVFGWKITE